MQPEEKKAMQTVITNPRDGSYVSTDNHDLDEHLLSFLPQLNEAIAAGENHDVNRDGNFGEETPSKTPAQDQPAEEEDILDFIEKNEAQQ